MKGLVTLGVGIQPDHHLGIVTGKSEEETLALGKLSVPK